jgi:hypothetical protein
MSKAGYITDSENNLDRMRKTVLEWLQEKSENRDALAGSGEQMDAIVQRFLHRASAAGFGCNVVETSQNGLIRHQVYGTHNGASFIGFKQPPLIAGCAALLANDWCRSWLG